MGELDSAINNNNNDTNFNNFTNFNSFYYTDTPTNGCRCEVERAEVSHSRIVGGTEITPVSSY